MLDHNIGARFSIILMQQKASCCRRKSKNSMTAGIWNNPIVTEVTRINNYYVAEDYHQEYFENNPNAGYCRVVVAPKVAKFRKKFVDRLKKEYA